MHLSFPPLPLLLAPFPGHHSLPQYLQDFFFLSFGRFAIKKGRAETIGRGTGKLEKNGTT
jgi:hypothetical protein